MRKVHVIQSRLSMLAVSRMLDVSPSAVRYYSDTGQLPASRNARGDREFQRSEVLKFAARRAAQLQKQAQKLLSAGA